MDFRASYLPDKYWHRKSILVPKKKVVVDARFKDINDIFHNYTERNNFEVYWVEYMVFGNVRLIGEFNYCYIDGKFFHMEKVRNQGFVQNGQIQDTVWDYYIEYDDWMNDWLNDRVDIKGTISKTGDIRLVNENIVQVAPLIQGVNTYQTYNSKITNNGRKRRVLFNKEGWHYELGWMNPSLWREFNNEVRELSKKIDIPENQPNQSKLIIPWLITRGRYLEWYAVILVKLIEFLKGDLQVYDIKKVGSAIDYNQFKSKYGLKEIYSISSPHYNTYEISQSVNQHVRLKDLIDLSNFKTIEFLDNRLIHDYEKFEFKGFLNLIEPYLKAYDEIKIESGSKTIDFNYFVGALTIFNKYYGDVCWNDKLFEPPRFLTDRREGKLYKNVQIKRHDPDKMIWERQDTGALVEDIWWKNYLTNFVFSQRLMGRNFIFEPGTPKLYISFLRKIGNKKLEPGEKYSIGKDDKYPPKNPASWFGTNRIDELTEWLSWLNNNPDYLDPTFNAYSDNPIKFRYSSLQGNLILLDNSAFKFVDEKDEDFTIHEGAALLLPDYREKKYVLAEGIYFDGVTNLNVIDNENEKDDKDENHTYTLIKEIGKTEQNNTSILTKPKTDEILNNNSKYYEKYLTLLPLMIRWSKGYTFARNYNSYRFAYWFKNTENFLTNDVKYFAGITFQFPLVGCGFDIYALLKEYEEKISAKYLIWGFLADEETMRRNGWENRTNKNDNKFEKFIRSDPSDYSVSVDKNSEALKHNFNELIEIRCWVNKGMDNNLAELLTKLWVYYFGFRWDGSYNGACYKTNEFNNDYGYIYYSKPFNHRYYGFRMAIKNYISDSLEGTEKRGDKLLYGYNSASWNPNETFAIIGYKYVYGSHSIVNKSDTNHIGYLLSCMVNNIQIAQSPTNWETFGLFQTDHIKPDKFAFLLKAEKPWEWIKFDIPNPPPSNPFENLSNSANKIGTLANKNIKTNRVLNPDRYNLLSFSHAIDVTNEEWEISRKTFTEWTNLRIPLFIFKFLSPSLPESRFHRIDKTKWNNDQGQVDGQKKFDEFEKRFEHELQYSRSLIEQNSFFIDLVGTDYVAICRITVNGEYQFELISKTNDCFEKTEIVEHNFILTNPELKTFENTVKRINSNYELSVFGQRFPLKTRPLLEGEQIDIGLRVIPINDPKQSETSLWYMLSIQTQQDVQRIRIEVPKELTAMHNQSPYEREDILRKISYHAYERQMEVSQFELDKNKYRSDIDIRSRRIDIERNKELTSESVGMAQTALSTAQAVAYGASGWNPAGWAAAGVAGLAGAAALSGQGLGMKYSKQLYDLNREEHGMVSSHGMRSMENRGLLIAAKHQDAQAADRMALLNMQHNVSYPANSDALMYKEENKQFNLTDIHLIRYYPSGDQLNFLIKYYKEYGFNLIVPEVRCLGASYIHDHIQYVKITSNSYGNETIRRMIEERALMGITMVDNSDWHADVNKPIDDIGDINPDAKELYAGGENNGGGIGGLLDWIFGGN